MLARISGAVHSWRVMRFSALSMCLLLASACAGAKAPPVPSYAVLPSALDAKSGAPAALPADLHTRAGRIAEEALRDERAYQLLTELCDDIGARLSGSEALKRAVSWAEERLREAGHENVRAEPVQVNTWVRGPESLAMLTPSARTIPVLGLGGTVPTPKGGLRGELAVVSSLDELGTRGAELKGKIVLIDTVMPPFDPVTQDTSYGEVVPARLFGASMAARHGALAVLIRSITATSLGTLHTGAMIYDPAVAKIPAAAVSTETASWLHRLVERKERVTLALELASEDRGLSPSANVVAELRGRERPEEIVLIGGHLDSWDVGQGASDDGAGVVISMGALGVLRRLGLTPRRTVRVVLFTNEENGLAGAREYAEAHAGERHVAAVESDFGAGRVTALGIDTEPDEGEPQAVAALAGVLDLLRPLGVSRVAAGHSGADVGPLVRAGALGIGLGHDGSHYFDLHHSEADTLDKIKPEDVAQSVAAMAVLAYALAELDLALPSRSP
jgi:carboxypeptidase Q